MSPCRVLLADDHVIFRQGIRAILESFADLKVVGEVGDGLNLVNMTRELVPDLIILDISMPGLRGIEATREIKAIHPGVKILILTMHKDKEYLYYALSAGAEGFLLKEDADTELFDAIETVSHGGTYISPLLTATLPDDFIKKWHRDQVKPNFDPLTTREREILKFTAEGKSSKEIAGLLCISFRTVQHHRENIMRKLKAGNTADLVRYAIRKGYISTT